VSHPAIRCIRASNPSPMTLDGTRTFLVGTDRPVVIDPGPDDPAHVVEIVRALGGRTPAAILLTHSHADHAGGAGALARETGAPVLAARGARGSGYAPGLVTEWIGEGAGVETDAGPVRAVATPGHAPEHLAFHWTAGAGAEGRVTFVGDLLMGSGDTTWVAPPEGDLAAYLRSLDRVEALGAEVLYPAHGPALADPRAAVARYRAHRLERIGQVRAAADAMPGASPAELVPAVYGPGLDPALVAAAEGSVRAILTYLKAAD
jgi:glyoxylase-like metal-dependent hydrolase (beta-lactamase superfamily II)